MSTSKINNSVFAELIRANENGEFDKALKICNKVLAETPNDEKIIHCKVVCLIYLSQFEEAIRVIDKVGDYKFEKAYCLYRLNRIQDAWSMVASVQNPSWKVKELSAQILYKLERYGDSFEIYKELIKNSDDDYEDERETNLAAVVANMVNDGTLDMMKIPQLREHTYELCYNAACVLIACCEYSKATSKLKSAEELCRKTLEENDVAEEEIEAELAVIRVQIGYNYQMTDKQDRAIKMYNLVLKKKPQDSAVVAVASNNIITINKDQNVFDSKKKIKIVTAESLEMKLTSSQRQAIAINHCLLLLQMNQVEQCKKQVQLLLRKFPESGAVGSLIQAAIHCKEKKIQKAVDVLKQYAVNHPDKSTTLAFTLAQLLLMQGHISQACETLRTINDYISHTLGVVSALVTLYQSLEDSDSVIDVLTEAIGWHRKNDLYNPALNIIIRESAKIQLKNGNPREASKLLQDLCKRDPSDLKSLAQLIAAYSQFDSLKAKEVSKLLPSPSQTVLKIDIGSLESTSWIMGTKYVKKGAKSEAVPVSGSSDTLVQKRKKSKRKKLKFPKNYDANVDPDPERWLPKRERTSYKKKKDKRSTAIGKGTQGAIDDSSKHNMSSPSSAPNAAASPTVQGPRQQKGGGQKKKKKARW